MLARISLIACLVVLIAIPARAGENPTAKLAMHVVASSEYLDCSDLMPAACDSIEVDLSVAEVVAADGYGYIALLAYDIEGITAVEFAVDGWPTGRGAAALNGPYWCVEGTNTYGDHLGDGGATSLRTCVEPSENGMVLLAYLSFGPLEEEGLPITLSFIRSTYTEPEDSLLAVTDCTEDFVIDDVVLTSGCTVGGTYSGTMPDCVGMLGGETGGEEVGEEAEDQEFQWPVVVREGILYVYGNRLEPPFTFTFEDDCLWVNDVRLSPELGREPAEPGTVSTWARETFALNESVIVNARELIRRHAPRDSVVAVSARLYRQSDYVDSVQIRGEDLIVHWAGRVCPFRATLPWEDPPRVPQVSEEEISGRIVERMALCVRPGRMVFYGNGYWVNMNQARGERALRLLEQTADPNAEELGLIKGQAARDILARIELHTR